MSEKDASLLSDDELAAIEDMVASGRLDSDIFNANVDAETFAIARNEESLGGSSTAIFQINERFHRFFSQQTANGTRLQSSNGSCRAEVDEVRRLYS